MLLKYLQGSRRAVLARAALLTAIIALVDWRIDLNISFGFLYMFPMLLLGTTLSRWQVLTAAVACSALSDLFDPFPFVYPVSLPQDILVFCALAGAGLFSYEATRSKRMERENLARIEREMSARREAEEQLEFLINSSPAAIFTMDGAGRILLANAAAHRLLACDAESLPGHSISEYLAALGHVPSLDSSTQAFRTEMQCRGQRGNGEAFLANVFFSTYSTAAGSRLAALVVDASDDLREREEFNLDRLLAGSRILVSAVSHEIRNVCGAIAVIHQNLLRSGVLRGHQDFEALGALVDTLHRIASLELKQSKPDEAVSGIDLGEVLSDLRIVLEPYCRDSGITVKWEVPAQLPLVWADSHTLLQVFLNLTKNSERALQDCEPKEIFISARITPTSVVLSFSDTGPGLTTSDNLFQPFQKGAAATGLGLYLSRAFMRSFGGDLRHDASSPGCCFLVELAAL
jgi:two-component system sensor kinase FixL